MSNMWGDLTEVETMNTPQKILIEQAGYLNSKMENKVIASLVKSQIDSTIFLSEKSFNFDFILTSPDIKGYKYKLLRLSHDVQIYPLYLNIDTSIVEEIDSQLLEICLKSKLSKSLTNEYEILEEDTFLNVLKLILSSNTVKRVIRTLISLGEIM